MSNALLDSGLVTTDNIRDYFYNSLTDVRARRNTRASDSSLAYLVNLLSHYMRADRFFEWDRETGYSLRPLAILYGEAVSAADNRQRMAILRRLGDVALFVSGLFAPSLARKAVGVNYYIDMGGGAYGWLSSHLVDAGNATLDPDLFRELSENFSQFVGMLDEFAESCNLRSDRDLITLYEQWLQGHDPAIAARLEEKGLCLGGATSESCH